jgi:ATP-dependent DNA helicase RecG
VEHQELLQLIQLGENYKVEFKESIDKTFVEEVTAFANASGGKVLLGVTDDGNIKGVDISNSSRSRVQDTISQIKPSIQVEITTFENIMVIQVPEGQNKPYACSKGFFIRMGANSQKLDRDDIIEFFQSEGRVRFDEQVRMDVSFDASFDQSSFDTFIKISRITNVLSAKEVLLNLDCCVQREQYSFNNAGLLFFTKDPSLYMKHASVICALYKGVDKVAILDRKDIRGNLIEMIEESILFIKRHLNVRYEISETRRKEIPDIPEIALRESVINAICHRDYFEKGAQVMIEIFDDRVVISNPGGLPKGLNRSKFGKVSLSRNPIIASLLQRCEYIEKMGTGVQRMRKSMTDAGLPEP